MLDLGLSFLASVARDPEALAVVDGDVRLTYAQWYRQISALVAGFDAIGLKPGRSLTKMPLRMPSSALQRRKTCCGSHSIRRAAQTLPSHRSPKLPRQM